MSSENQKADEQSAYQQGYVPASTVLQERRRQSTGLNSLGPSESRSRDSAALPKFRRQLSYGTGPTCRGKGCVRITGGAVG